MAELTHQHEMLAIAEPVHRDFAARGARRLGLEFAEVFNELVAGFLERLHRYRPDLAPVHIWAEWQARTTLTALRRRHWRCARVLPPTAPALHRLTDDDENPAAIAEHQELLDRLREELADLTPKQLAAVSAAFGVGRPAVAGADLAAAIGRHASTAGQRVRRGLQQLALALGADPEAAGVGWAEGRRLHHERQRAERDAHLAEIAGPVDGTIAARRARVVALVALGLSFRNVARVVGVCRETCRADLAAASAGVA